MIEKSIITPEGWVVATLGEITSKLVDGSHNPPAKQDVGLPMLSAVSISNNKIDFSNNRLISKADFDIEHNRTKITAGDVLLTIVGAIGRSAVVAENMAPFTLQRSVAVLTPVLIEPKFLMYQFESPDIANLFKKNARGTAQKGIYLGVLGNIEVAIPPLNEQRRIVAKIEELFSELDNSIKCLKIAREQLKVYRQAILKYAFEGKLTAVWRKQNKDRLETSDQLLERIKKERRAKWEADLRAKGKDPAKVKYVEPAKPDIESLPKLPEKWCWATVEFISTKVVDGVHKKPSYVKTGIPFVTVRNLTSGPGINFEHLNYITLEDHREFWKRANPECGDILLSKDGTLGVVRVINSEIQFSIFVSVALIKPVIRDMSEYLGLALTSPQVQVQMVPKGSGLQHIHLEDLRRDCIPLAPLIEQRRIVEEVEQRLSILIQLEATVEANLKRAERLRQSILKEAFAGRLVSQDPNDEPASVLLERIRAEKTASQTNNKNNHYHEVKPVNEYAQSFLIPETAV